MLLHSYRVSK